MICVCGNQSSIPLAAIWYLNSGPKVVDVGILSPTWTLWSFRDPMCPNTFSSLCLPLQLHRGPEESSLNLWASKLMPVGWQGDLDIDMWERKPTLYQNKSSLLLFPYIVDYILTDDYINNCIHHCRYSNCEIYNSHELNTYIDDLCNAIINAFSGLISDFKHSKFYSLVRR